MSLTWFFLRTSSCRTLKKFVCEDKKPEYVFYDLGCRFEGIHVDATTVALGLPGASDEKVPKHCAALLQDIQRLFTPVELPFLQFSSPTVLRPLRPVKIRPIQQQSTQCKPKSKKPRTRRARRDQRRCERKTAARFPVPCSESKQKFLQIKALGFKKNSSSCEA